MKPIFFALALSLLLGSSSAFADAGAQGFVEREHNKLTQLLKQPATPSRDSQVTGALDAMLDYDVLAKRTFGEPCPPGVSGCTNHWKDLSTAQRTEVTDLLKKLVQKSYRKNLLKTLDYEITIKSASDANGETKVRTVAKSKLNARETPVQVDYFVHGNAESEYRVIDIVTEGSSLAKNYYSQFHKMLTTPDQGYPHVVKKLKEKLAKP